MPPFAVSFLSFQSCPSIRNNRDSKNGNTLSASLHYVMAVKFVKLGKRFEVEIPLRSVPKRRHIVFLSRQLVHQYIYLDLPRQAVVVDAAFANRYPQVLENDDERPNERIALMERSAKRVTIFGVPTSNPPPVCRSPSPDLQPDVGCPKRRWQ